jgi:hypothetical protein
MATILRFSFTTKKEWSNAEQAEFARAAALLRRSGLQIACEWGLSDEGDPWTIFLRQDTGDVIVHVAKIDGRLFATSTASGDVVVGPNLRSVMNTIVRSQPLVLPPSDQASQIHLHPATVLLAFIATAFVWSQKDSDAPTYEWRVGPDGAIDVERIAHGHNSPGNLLRDAALSKEEISRFGLDARFALSDSMTLAAATAALALAVVSHDAFSFDLGMPLAELEEFRQAPEFTMALAPRDGDAPHVADGADPLTLTLASDLALHDETDATPARHVPEPSHGSAPSGPAFSEPGNGHSQVDLASASDRATGVGDSVSPIQIVPGIEPRMAKDAAPPAPAVEATAAHDDLRPTHGASFVFAPDSGGQLLALVFGVKDASDIPASLITSAIEHGRDPAPGNAAGLSGPPLPEGPGATSSSTPDNGYHLLAEIVSFAWNPAHELSPPPAELQLFQQALVAQPFLPNANKVLIIDMPDLQADIFKFSGGLAMMSQKTAEKLLPDVTMSAQSQLSLSDGSVLKLIGVIDLHPDPHLS